MNTILLMILVSGVDLFFVENSPDLLVKVSPSIETQQVAICYSFRSTTWDTIIANHDQNRFSAVIHSPDSLKVIGIYCIYDNNAIDDNNGELYLYEVSTSPRFLLRISLDNLGTMLSQAKKKVLSKTHIDEAMLLLEYVQSILNVVPYVPGSAQEMQKNTLQSELNTINQLLAP
jgi:hypothetical protein